MSTWQDLMRQSYRDVEDLRGCIKFSEDELRLLNCVQKTYPMLTNPYYLSLIEADDVLDPIRLLSVPNVEELDAAGQEDTSGESDNTKLAGLQHKYGETALLLSTSECAMYCRHCFRRRFVGDNDDEIVRNIDAVVDYIREHESITSVLISGGDAFMNSNLTIHKYLEALCGIDHVRNIRFGTRTPVVLPQRITSDEALVQVLEKYARQKQLYVVTHFDHPREVTPEAAEAVYTLLSVGVPVRNQTVLLKGINDSSSILAELMRAVSGIGVIPYYVFQCRPVVGVQHRFQVPLREAFHIVEDAKHDLDGMSKCFRFIMSHPTGKIEILGEIPETWTDDGVKRFTSKMLFKYHQAKNRSDIGRMFALDISDEDCWIDV